MRSLERCRFLALLGLALFLGCSSDDNPTDPGNGGGGGGGVVGVGQFQSQIEALSNLYVGANAEAYASLETLGPFIAASLRSPLPPASKPEAMLQVTCFSGVAGTTYIFNGTTYEAGPAMGAPDNGVRYVLYRVDSSSQPVLSDSIGYLEVRCSVTNATSKSVGMSLVANGITAVIVDGSATENTAGGNVNVTGYMAAPSAPLLSLSINGLYGTQSAAVGTFYTTNDIQLQMSTVDSLMLGKRTIALSAFYFPEPNWHVLTRVHGSASTEVVTGGVIYYSDTETFGIDQLVACVSGGTLSNPTFSEPSEDCNEFGYDIGPALSSGDHAAITSGYRQLKSIHDLLAEIAIVAFGIPIGSSA